MFFVPLALVTSMLSAIIFSRCAFIALAVQMLFWILGAGYHSWVVRCVRLFSAAAYHSWVVWRVPLFSTAA
jgi:hypothetical protein